MSETLPVRLEVNGQFIPAGAIREAGRWRMNAARYPDVIEWGFDVVKVRDVLQKRLAFLIGKGLLPAPKPVDLTDPPMQRGKQHGRRVR